MGEWFLSRRDRTIVARYEVPGRSLDISRELRPLVRGPKTDSIGRKGAEYEKKTAGDSSYDHVSSKTSDLSPS